MARLFRIDDEAHGASAANVGLAVWPTVFGATLVVAQLWRIDRFGWLWERVNAA